VEEALHRMALPDPTTVSVNGGTINAAILDDSIPYDPNWRVRIFLTSPGTEPSPGIGETHTVTIQDAGTWLEYSSAADVTEALMIEHKWQDLDDDGLREDGEIVLYDAGQYPPENFTRGSPVEVVTATGKSATAQREILVEATKFPLNINARAALLCDKGVDVRGNVSICGHDHSMTTPVYTMLPNCQGWEYCYGPPRHTYCSTIGCVYAIMTTGDEIDKRGTTDVSGFPVPENTDSTNVFYTLAQFLGISQEELDVILAAADYSNTSVADPQEGITYVDNAGAARAKWLTGIGTGLLYLTGDLEVGGNFAFKGLIYVEGDFKLTGTPWILGAVIVKGVSEYAFTGGDPAILYSSEAIAYYLQRHLGYIKIGWKETGG
jgi:hypothetical protein